MKTEIRLEYLAFQLLLFSYVNVFGQLPSPANVRVESLNTHYVLKWDWGQEPNGTQNVTFTAQYLPKYRLRRPQPNWIMVCRSVQEMECDFTKQEFNYLGMFVLRVQAAEHTLTHTLYSPWADLTFCPDSDAALGPPSRVEISSQGRGLLEVKLSDPVTHDNRSMRKLIPNLRYRIQYWRPDMQTKVEEVDGDHALVTLSSLSEWTLFCVRAQTRYDFYKKASNFTTPQCIRTQGQTPYWQVAILFLLALASMFVLGLLFAGLFHCFFAKLKSTFFCSNQLPIHIQEYLQEKSSDRPCLLTPETELELVFDQLDVCPEVMVVVAPETEFWPEPADVCHSRHGSGDSGVYSAEESGGGVILRAAEKRRGARELEEEEREALKRDKEEDEGIQDGCLSVTEG